MTYQAALGALADPTRRLVFEQLRQGPQSVTRIAALVPVSRPAVSQHLAVLKRAGMVFHRAEGSRRVYYMDLQGLAKIRIWLDEVGHEALLSFRETGERAPKS